MKRDVVALWLAARDPRVPYLAKVLSAVVAAYALSPFDLIPDFIPVVGYLDDLVLVPLGIWVAVRLVPPAVMAELRDRAAREPRFSSRLGLAIVVISWFATLAAAAWLTWPVWRSSIPVTPGNTNPR